MYRYAQTLHMWHRSAGLEVGRCGSARLRRSRCHLSIYFLPLEVVHIERRRPLRAVQYGVNPIPGSRREKCDVHGYEVLVSSRWPRAAVPATYFNLYARLIFQKQKRRRCHAARQSRASVTRVDEILYLDRSARQKQRH